MNVHDFEDKKLGKVVPYGVYDVTANASFVSVGITSDTAEFAVQSIRCWRECMGRQRYPHARELTITADCGGSNGARVRLWKVELQKLADETGLVIHVHHYPPGTSKWNKIEHRLFCHITQNWHRSTASGLLERPPFSAWALTNAKFRLWASRVTTSSCSLNRSATSSSNRSAQRCAPDSVSISCALTRTLF